MTVRMISWDESVPVLPDKSDLPDLSDLKAHLASGGLLAIPTESSYGLAVDPRSRLGVEAIYRLKERDRGKPLPVVAGSVEQLALLGIDTSDAGVRAVAKLWPAPLSLVLPAGGAEGPWPASGDGATLAVRIPAHERLRALLMAIECPLTATSANLSGQDPILDPAPLREWLAEGRAWILDGGPLSGGLPSTLVVRQNKNWRVIRAGRFPIDRLPELRDGDP